MPFAVKYPLTRDEQDGFYKMNNNYIDIIVQNFKNLMLTEPGERVMNPEFGVGIKSLLFSQNDSFTRGSISSRTQKQVSKYMPFLEIIEMNFSQEQEITGNPNGNIFYMEVKLNVKDLDKEIIVPFEISEFT